jgi:hypothetical protein
VRCLTAEDTGAGGSVPLSKGPAAAGAAAAAEEVEEEEVRTEPGATLALDGDSCGTN